MAKKKQKPKRTMRDLEEELKRVYSTLVTIQKDAEQLRLQNGRLAEEAKYLFQKIDTFLVEAQNLNAKWTVAMKHPTVAPWLGKLEP